MENQTINNPQMSSEMFAMSYDYKMNPALMQPTSVITPINNQATELTTVKFIPQGTTNATSFRDLISKKITEYDCIYLRRKLINKVEYTSAFVNGTTIISHNSLNLIKDVARELRDIHKIDFKLKLVK